MMTANIDQWLTALSAIMTANAWFAPVLALAAGVLTSFTPCTLSSIPLVIAYVGGTGVRETRRALILSAVFSAGMALSSTLLGLFASILGRLMQGTGPWWYIVLGVLMVLMALQIWGIYDFIPSTYAVGRNKKRGMVGAFLAGILGGLFSTPCSTPVLIALLALVAEKGSLFWGALLLLIYSIGHCALAMIAGTSVGFVKKLNSGNRYGTVSKGLNIMMGTVILMLACYMFYLGF